MSLLPFNYSFCFHYVNSMSQSEKAFYVYDICIFNIIYIYKHNIIITSKWIQLEEHTKHFPLVNLLIYRKLWLKNLFIWGCVSCNHKELWTIFFMWHLKAMFISTLGVTWWNSHVRSSKNYIIVVFCDF